MITIVLNGESYQLAEGQTLDQLIAQLQLQGQALALAVNRSVVSRKAWPAYVLSAQDQVDIVRAIGGG